MAEIQTYTGEERRTRDRSRGILLRRRRSEAVAPESERRRSSNANGFDIAAALELHLDECTTRRAMLNLLESWLREATDGGAVERDENYINAVQHAVQVVKSAPDVATGIAILQRQSES